MLNVRKIAAVLPATWTFGNLNFEILNLNSKITLFHKTPHFSRFSLLCPLFGMWLPPTPAKKPQRRNTRTSASFTMVLDVNHLRSILRLNKDVRNGIFWIIHSRKFWLCFIVKILDCSMFYQPKTL